MAFARLQLRGDTAANWTSANPVLALREIAVETDTAKFKIGNGVATWTALAYGGIAGPGVPAGGAAGQVLAKTSATDFDTAWVAATGRHMVPIMAGAIQPSVAGGCSAVTSIASAAGQPDIVTVDFDTTTQEFAQFAIPMPESWDEGTLTFAPIWSHAATTTNFGVVWGLQAVAVSDLDTIAAAFGTAQTSADTGGVTNALYVGPQSSAITVAGVPAAGDMVFFRVYRDPANASDTLAIDARLHGIRLYMTTTTVVD